MLSTFCRSYHRIMMLGCHVLLTFFDKRSVEVVTGSDEEHWKTRGLRSVSVAGCSDVTDKGVQVC